MYSVAFYVDGGRRIVTVFGFKRYILSLVCSIAHEVDFYTMGKLHFSLDNFKKCLAHYELNVPNVSSYEGR